MFENQANTDKSRSKKLISDDTELLSFNLCLSQPSFSFNLCIYIFNQKDPNTGAVKGEDVIDNFLYMGLSKLGR